jgi:hypothetical protein
MTPSDPGEVRIRNRRYRPWSELAGLMWLVLFLFVTTVWQFLAPSHRLRAYPLFACLLGGTVYCLRMGMLVLDLTERPRLGGPEAARAVWNWVFRGIRPADPRRVRATIALALLGWLAPRRISVASLTLGDSVAFDSRVPVPAGAVRRVGFAPDPAEDYAELDGPVYYCAAAIELDMGREFRLILDESDAGRLREWATGKGISVCDFDGYRLRTTEPASEARGDE